MQIDMNKILFATLIFLFSSTVFSVSDKVTQFYDKADADFDRLGQGDGKLPVVMQSLRTFFSTYNPESLKLTTEILNSKTYTVAEKEKFMSVIMERQKALQNAFMNRLDYLVNDALEKKCNTKPVN